MKACMPKQPAKTQSKKPSRPKAAARGAPTGSKASAGKAGRGKGPIGKHRTIQPRRPAKSVLPRLPGRGLSWDRKLDMIGVGLTLIGLLTLLALLSTNNGQLSGGWLSLLSQVFGWGMYLFPLGLIGLGLWLILRHFDRLPRLAVERVTGVLLLYWNLLVWLHFFTFPEPSLIYMVARNGQGGGYIGAAVLALLHAGLGWSGAGVVLAAWTLIALALALDVSVPELFRWLAPMLARLKERWAGWRAQRSAAAAQPFRAKPPLPRLPPRPSGPVSLPTSPGGGAVAQGQGIATSMTGLAPSWVLPSLADILDDGAEAAHDDEADLQRARVIEDTLASFGAPAKVVEINRGPTITQFGVEPGFQEARNGLMRVRVSKIAALADDLALALSARRIRIQAPVPSKSFVGIEVPNEQIANVALRDTMESENFQRLNSPLRFALGQDVAGLPVAADLAAMPHLLIAGTTGSGKSVCVNALICCLLLQNTPDDLRLVMVDPKRVELTNYNGIPHLLAPVVVEMERVVAALQWVAREMDARYQKLAQLGARNIADYNQRAASSGDKKLPHLVLIIDELADLMMLAPDETERTITRLAQLARATGIHLVIATQRPSVDVVTGLIKANFPARIAFAVASGVDSRVILDQPGAERLLGRGDMLFQAPDAAAPVRLQGVFVSEGEIQRLVSYWQSCAPGAASASTAIGGTVDVLPSGVPLKQLPMWEEQAAEEETDPLYAESVDLVRRQGRASISMLQRRLRIGYTRAARLIETMQVRGIVGPSQPGTQGLEVLDYGPAAPPVDEQ
jgi:S-DNA-T family DNA segregation ATPase FtsK/SpoIIIE